MPAATRLLVQPPPITPASDPQPRWEDVRASATALAEQLRPLPAALSELAVRINRHCANSGRDAELARVVEAMRARTFELFLAIHRLAEAAGGRQGEPVGEEGG
jgi:hypothetical protein